DQAPAVAIRESRDRQSEEGIEEYERGPEQDADLHVGDIQIAFDRPHQQRHDAAIDGRDQQTYRQHAERVPRAPWRWPGVVGILCGQFGAQLELVRGWRPAGLKPSSLGSTSRNSFWKS